MSELALKKINYVQNTKNKVLDLGCCGLDSIPEEVYNCTWITFLILSNVSKNIGPKNTKININANIKKLHNLKVLIVSGLDLSSSDLLSLSEVKTLEKLDLSNCNVLDINFIHTLHNLEELHIQNTDIFDISPVSHLKKLNLIDASNTKIADINPLAILKNLAFLDLSLTKVIDLTPLKNLNNLKTIRLANTNIKDVSPLKNCKNLKNILIQYTKVTNIEPLLDIIKNNVWINYGRENRLKNANYEATRGLCLTGCPIITPPIEVINRGRDAVLNYFDETKRIGEVKLFEAKLLIIGEGGAGKTTLARKIIDRNALMPSEGETTKGIDIFKYRFKVNENTFRLNIWDFGGQEIYHSTHQFFLTKRSLYILLDDTRKDDKSIHDETFNYWLQVVDLLSDKSPLIIIQNEKGDRSKEIDFKGMQGRFEIIKDRIRTNLFTLRNFDNVLNSIQYYALKLPHIGEKLPSTWVEIRSELETLTLNGNSIIRFREYQDLCEKYGIITFEGALHLINYLHDLGVLLHWHDGSVLEDIVILKNSWATNAVYNLLDDEQIKISQKGRFGIDDVTRVLISEYPYEYFKVILALMEKNRFELIYKLPDQETATWIAPQLLPVERPPLSKYDTNLKDNDLIVLIYDYDFMPKGIVSRLIVRLNKYILGAEYAWRLGVVLTRKESFAIIEETFGGRKLIVKCYGKFKKELITIITEDIDKLNNSFPGIKVKKFIPCTCAECKGSPSPIFYDYQDLITRKERGRKTIECSQSYKEIIVTNLLDGIFLNINENIRIFEKSKKYVTEGDIIKAIELIIDLIPEAGILMSRIKNAEKEFNLGRINYQELEKVRNLVNTAAFNLVNEYLGDKI